MFDCFQSSMRINGSTIRADIWESCLLLYLLDPQKLSCQRHISAAASKITIGVNSDQMLSLAPEFFQRQRESILSRRRGSKDDSNCTSFTNLPYGESEKPCPTQYPSQSAILPMRRWSVIYDYHHSNGYNTLIRRQSLPVTSTEKEMLDIEEKNYDHIGEIKGPGIQVSGYPFTCNNSADDLHFLWRQCNSLMHKRHRLGKPNLCSHHNMEEEWHKPSHCPSHRNHQTMLPDMSVCRISECDSENLKRDLGCTSNVQQSYLWLIDGTKVRNNICQHDGCQCKNLLTPAPTLSHSSCRQYKNVVEGSFSRNGQKIKGISLRKELGKQLARTTESSLHDNVHGIWQAVTNQDYEMLCKLVAAPAAANSINHLHPPGVAVLHQACVLGNLRIVKLLVQKGADVNLRTWKNLSPIKLATISGHFDTAQLLLLTGADINDIRDGI